MKNLLKFKKLFASILSAAILIPLAVSSVHAFTSGPDNTYLFQFENAVFKTQEMNLQSFVYETMRAITVSATVSPLIGCLSCPRDDSGQAQYGMVSSISNLMAGIYVRPPASGVQYIADIGRKLNIVSPVYAQESEGFRHFQLTLLPVWRAFRNVSYFFFIIIMIVMGFAIMFRVKISPQAVITIQNAVPKVILAIVLITFSYALVGLLIDIMIVLNNLIIVIFKRIMFDTFPPEIAFIIEAPLIYSPWTQVPITSTAGFLHTLMLVSLPPIFVIFFVLTLFLLLTNTVAFVITGGLSTPTVVVSLIFLAIVAIVLIIAFIRLMWTLFKAYAMVVLGLIFAPFHILLGALPGSNSVSNWFKNLVSNLAVLPVTLVMVFLAGYLTFASLYFNFQTVGTGPGMIQLVINLLTLRGGGSDSVIDAIVSTLESQIENSIAMTVLLFVALAILLITPRVSELVQSFMAGKPFGYGAALGESITGGKVGNIIIAGASERGLEHVQAAKGIFANSFIRGAAGTVLTGVRSVAKGR